MALLQIAEPGQSPLPHQHKRAVGIDLGTTNSLVATVRGGRTEVLPDAAGAALSWMTNPSGSSGRNPNAVSVSALSSCITVFSC